MRKTNVPNTEPCGTPARIGAQSERWPLRTNLWCLSLRKLRNRFSRRFPNIPRDSSLYKNTLCYTLSSAFEISKKLPLTSSDGLSSKSAYILCTTDISKYIHESLGRNSHWCGVSNSLFSWYKNAGLYVIRWSILPQIVNKVTGR